VSARRDIEDVPCGSEHVFGPSDFRLSPTRSAFGLSGFREGWSGSATRGYHRRQCSRPEALPFERVRLSPKRAPLSFRRRPIRFHRMAIRFQRVALSATPDWLLERLLPRTLRRGRFL
jgi:hypothetical protein